MANLLQRTIRVEVVADVTYDADDPHACDPKWWAEVGIQNTLLGDNYDEIVGLDLGADDREIDNVRVKLLEATDPLTIAEQELEH